jgi:hypothetical protein
MLRNGIIKESNESNILWYLLDSLDFSIPYPRTVLGIQEFSQYSQRRSVGPRETEFVTSVRFEYLDMGTLGYRYGSMAVVLVAVTAYSIWFAEVSMPNKDPGPSIKRPHQYEGLKKHGFTKSQAAAISNAQAKKANSGKTPTRKQATRELRSNKRKRNGRKG